MAVHTFKEIDDGRGGGESITGKQSVRRYTRVFRVVTTDNYDDAAIVMQHPDCPRIGHVFPNDPFAWCRRVDPRSAGFGKRLWIVTVAYSSEQEKDEDPSNDPVTVSWGTEHYSEVAVRDIDGKPVLSSAKTIFDPQGEKDASRVTATIHANLALVPTWILDTEDLVNSATFTLDGRQVPAGCAKVSGVTVGEPQRRNEIAYRALTITLHMKRQPKKAGDEAKAWYLWLQDAGFQQWKEGDDKPDQGHETIMDDGTPPEPVTAPWPLNGHGRALTKAALMATGDISLSFEVLEKANFIGMIPGCTLAT